MAWETNKGATAKVAQLSSHCVHVGSGCSIVYISCRIYQVNLPRYGTDSSVLLLFISLPVFSCVSRSGKVQFDCIRFEEDTLPGYCFTYVSTANSGAVTEHISLCLSTVYQPGNRLFDCQCTCSRENPSCFRLNTDSDTDKDEEQKTAVLNEVNKGDVLKDMVMLRNDDIEPITQNSPFLPCSGGRNRLPVYLLRLTTEGWPGWVGLVSLAHCYFRDLKLCWSRQCKWHCSKYPDQGLTLELTALPQTPSWT